MKLSEANIRFRPRTHWEAIDLGFRMVAPLRLKLALLWLSISLPFVALITLIFWQSPSWAFLFIWWIKPIFEYATLYVLSINVFSAAPPFKACVKEGYKLIFKRRVIADLTLRRFSPYRTVNLPIRQLEELKGQQYRHRSQLIDHQSSGAPFFTLLSANIEFILYCGVGAFLWMISQSNGWGVFAQDHASFLRSIEALVRFFQEYSEQELNTMAHISNFAYIFILAFWGPIYVAGGFSIYLNTRSQLEAWDVELVFKRMAIRLGQSLIVCLSLALCLYPATKTYAEPAPDTKKITQIKDSVVHQAPFPHFKEDYKWAWKQDTKTEQLDPSKPPKHRKNTLETDVSGPLANIFRIIFWIVLAAALGAIVYYLFRDPTWLAAMTSRHKTAPKVMFGMDVTPESLPDDVGKEAAKLFDVDPRAALSLLYRASLSQLIHHYDTPLRNGHTEGEVLSLAAQTAPNTQPYMQLLTTHWVNLAYGHQLPPKEAKHLLCDQYRHYFPQEDSLPKEQQIRGNTR
ncbi:DUF4129 domain-containing protein [Neisseria sp. Ec49-e6-T10]|uniref:DUF4129 domain-containing protein n=1 Tax=Neisseria sp. Ec49-e6-T10 TaxID=3140744 RepID=UPI003EBE0EDE